MCQDLPDGSAEQYHQARRYVSGRTYARRLTGVGRRGLDAEFFPIARELVR
jgi:hypothetical protein